MAGQNAGTMAETALGKALGLDDSDVDAMGELFTGLTAQHGVDGGKIFARLRKGMSMLEALDLPKGTVEFLYSRAYQWLQVGRVDKAEPLFRVLCMLDGSSVDYWIGYSVCLKGRQAYPDALAAVKNAIRLRSDHAVAHYHGFDASARAGKWDEAEEHYRQFQRLADDSTPAPIRAEVARLRTAVDLHRSTKKD